MPGPAHRKVRASWRCRCGRGPRLQSRSTASGRTVCSTAFVSPIDWSQVVFLFRDHLELTRSQEFTDNVLFVLLEKP